MDPHQRGQQQQCATYNDKPWITIGANDDLLVTWSDLGMRPTFSGSRMMVARSTDHGATFTRSTILMPSDGNVRALEFPCLDRSLGAGAPLYVVAIAGTPQSLMFAVELYRSADLGVTWMKATPNPVADAVFQDPTCEVAGSELWIAYAAGNTPFTPTMIPPATAVRVVHGRDTAGTLAFDAPITVTSGPNGTEYMLPQLARTTSGALEVVYYRGQSGQPGALERAHSTDGATWTLAALAMPGTFTRDRTQQTWLGDYFGLAVAGGTLYATFGDNSGPCPNAPTRNCTHINFTRAAAP